MQERGLSGDRALKKPSAVFELSGRGLARQLDVAYVCGSSAGARDSQAPCAKARRVIVSEQAGPRGPSLLQAPMLAS